MTTTIHDFRSSALGNQKNVMLNSINADGTIDVVLVGALPKIGDHVLLTVTNKNTDDQDIEWVVVSVAENKDHNTSVCHVLLKRK